jgi:trimethylamine:corrinoid methyltransferase-like protein
MRSQFCAVAAGNDLIVNCGMFATGMTCSHEQLLIDEEISAISRRIAAGIEVSADTIAADLIRQIGPRGDTYQLARDKVRQYAQEPVPVLPEGIRARLAEIIASFEGA